MIPDPVDPDGPQVEPVSDPAPEGQPDSIQAADEKLDGYDQAEADSFPASDPPAASEPGVG